MKKVVKFRYFDNNFLFITADCSMSFQISNSHIFKLLTGENSRGGPSLRHNSKELNRKVIDIIHESLPEYFLVDNYDNEKLSNELDSLVYKYCANLVRMWKKGTGISEFKKQYSEWLSKCLILPSPETSYVTSSISKIGRPEKSFSECSEKSKKRKVEDLVKNVPKEELLFAAKCTLNKSGQKGERSAALLIAQATEIPQQALKIKRAWDEKKKNKREQKKMEGSAALGTLK